MQNLQFFSPLNHFFLIGIKPWKIYCEKNIICFLSGYSLNLTLNFNRQTDKVCYFFTFNLGSTKNL